jgi:hypothetical protein
MKHSNFAIMLKLLTYALCVRNALCSAPPQQDQIFNLSALKSGREILSRSLASLQFEIVMNNPPLQSTKLSTMTTSTKATGSDLNGYMIVSVSTVSECNTIVLKTAYLLNYCWKALPQHYLRYRAMNSSHLTLSIFSDSECSKSEYKAKLPNNCGSLFKYSYSSTNAITLPRPSLSLT